MRHSEQVRLVGFIGLANTALFLAYALRRLLRLRQSTVRRQHFAALRFAALRTVHCALTLTHQWLCGCVVAFAAGGCGVQTQAADAPAAVSDGTVRPSYVRLLRRGGRVQQGALVYVCRRIESALGMFGLVTPMCVARRGLKAVYTVHSIGKIGMLVSLGLLMDEWCSVLYMNEHLFPRPWYLSKVFLSACVIAVSRVARNRPRPLVDVVLNRDACGWSQASCCMLVNAGLIVSHRELSELHEGTSVPTSYVASASFKFMNLRVRCGCSNQISTRRF